VCRGRLYLSGLVRDLSCPEDGRLDMAGRRTRSRTVLQALLTRCVLLQTHVPSSSQTPSSSSPPLQRTHSPSPPPAIPSHLTPTKDKRRISFISYNDLLLSVPTTVTPLGDITSGNLSPEHLPGTVSPTVPTRSPVVSSSNLNSTAREVEHKPSWDAGLGARGLGLGEGEWQREGLGKGLEQRLEDLVREDSGHSPRGSTSTPPLSRERS